MKATSGPWEAQSHEVRAGNRIVARTTARGWNLTPEDLAQRAADAQLIASAPSLLAALQGMVELWESGESKGYCSACESKAPCDSDGDPLDDIPHKDDCPLDIARAAISKATGGEV